MTTCTHGQLARQCPICERDEEIARLIKERERLVYCHAASDGDCSWEHCPQNSDNEPENNGRSCPLIWLDRETEFERADHLDRMNVVLSRDRDRLAADLDAASRNMLDMTKRIHDLADERDRLATENARLRTVAEEIVYIHGYYSDASDSAYRRALSDSMGELIAALGEEG